MIRRVFAFVLGCALFAVACAMASDLACPPIVGRDRWKARPPIKVMKPHRVDRITIHNLGEHVDDRVDVIPFMQRFQLWCQQPQKLEDGRWRSAWADIPYHYIVFRDGTIAQGRDARFAGDTNTTYDPTGHLLIALAGDLEQQPVTDAQYDSTVRLCAYFCSELHLSPSGIKGHRDYAQTDCPGKNMYVRMAALREEVSRLIRGQ